MGEQSGDRLARALLFAPPIFVAHFMEESPGFVTWFNAHVARGITTELFWTVNITALVITVLVVLAYWTTKSPTAVALVVAWFSLLILTNAIFHITGAIIDGRYVPGLATAVVLYIPYYGWIVWEVARENLIRPTVLTAAAVFGGIPMAVHGYRILFLGTRLF